MTKVAVLGLLAFAATGLLIIGHNALMNLVLAA